MSKPLIYAELLSNIRQISVIAAFDTPCDASTNVELAADGQVIVLHHHGNITTLKLPGRIAPDARLQKPALGSKELSWRLPLNGPLVRANADNAVSNEAPWPATSLKEDMGFSCRSCGSVTLRRGAIRSWRDLPSENWAEMMDFWHCHKPDVPETNGNGHARHSYEDQNASRGYGANTKFTAQPGVGFVGLATFLVAESDCSGVEGDKSADEEIKHPRLVCSKCKNSIGHVDHQAEGYRLYKWRLKSSDSSDQPSLSSMLTSQFQSIMLAQCCSRLVFVPMNWKPSQTTASSPLPFLSMWILNPTIRYSTSVQNTTECTIQGTLAMKIFWKTISAAEANKLLDSPTHEEVSLPAETIIETERLLRQSAVFLPPSGRRFQGWDVGLLERFDGEG